MKTPAFACLSPNCKHLLLAFLFLLSNIPKDIALTTTLPDEFSPVCANNLLQNGSFDDDMAHWTTINGNSYVYPFSDNTFAIFYAFFFKTANLYQDVPVEAGTILNLSFDIGVKRPLGVHRAGMKFLNANKQEISVTDIEIIHDTYNDKPLKWHHLGGVTPTNTKYVRVFFTADMSFEINNVCLIVGATEICDNGIDDDGDGLIDLQDTDCEAVCNLINNPAFEEDTTTWELYSNINVSATLTIDTTAQLAGTNAAYIDISQASDTPWHLEIGNSGHTLVANTQYHISILAKAEANKTIYIALQSREMPWTVYWMRPITLIITEQTYHFNYTPTETLSNVAFMIRAGDSDTNFWIDNIKLIDQACIAPPIEICDNNIDDDGDGQIDCEDGDCSKPIIHNIDLINPYRCPFTDNAGLNVYAEGSDLEYSIDEGLTYQTSYLFEDLANGIYSLRVRNAKSGCFIDSTNIILEPNPKYLHFDRDQDGLTDCEESTGIDDPTTVAVPEFSLFSDGLKPSSVNPCNPTPFSSLIISRYPIFGYQESDANLYIEKIMYEPDDIGVVIGGNNQQFVVFLGQEIPSGMPYTIIWRKVLDMYPNDTIIIEESLTHGAEWTPAEGSPFSISDTSFFKQEIIASTTMRMLRFSSASQGSVEIDALSHPYEVNCFDCSNFSITKTPSSCENADGSATIHNLQNASAVRFKITSLEDNSSILDTSYFWSNSFAEDSYTFTNLSAGFYKLVVTGYDATSTCEKTFHLIIESANCNSGCDPAPTTIFAANFEDTIGDNNWTVDSAALDGNWQIDKPNLLEFPAYRGLHNLVTGSRYGQDVDKGRTSATSPTILLPDNEKDITLQFHYYFAHNANRNSLFLINRETEDHLQVQIRDASNDSLLTTVINEVETTVEQHPKWTLATTDLSEYAGKAIYIVVIAADLNTASKVEAAIDELIITESIPCIPSDEDTTSKVLPLFHANFENTIGDNNWILVDSSAADGNWIFDTPHPYNSNDTPMEVPAYEGTKDLLTGSGNLQDLDGGPAIIRSPNITLPNDSSLISLAFNYYFANDFNSDNNDYLQIQIRDASNDSVLTTVVNEIGDANARPAIWTLSYTELTNFAGKTIYIYVDAGDLGGASKVEAAIDNVLISALGASPSPIEICNNSIDDDGDGLIDCEDTDCVQVSIDSINTSDPSNCPLLNNGHINIVATGTNLQYSIDGGTTFQYAPLFTNLVSGIYFITIKDALSGCNSLPFVTAVLTDSLPCLGIPEPIEICNNGIDDDGDGLIDCEDDDCETPLISTATLNSPNNCPLLNNGSIDIIATGTNLQYSIDGGINFQATSFFENLSSDLYPVTVKDSVSGCRNSNFTVVIVEDLINLPNCSAALPPIDTTTAATRVYAKILLEGYYNQVTNQMNTTLQDRNLLPFYQPYSIAPWHYEGKDSTLILPSNAVDWILLTTRDTTGAILDQAAGFINQVGELMATDGTLGIPIRQAVGHTISIHHRSHLAVLSATPYDGTLYDFTQDVSKALGNSQLKEIAGRYALYAGDYDASGIINATDLNLWKVQRSALNQYLSIDGDGSTIVNSMDYNLWTNNRAKVGERWIWY